MATAWVEVLDTPIDGHQKGEVFEIHEHYAKRFEEQGKAKIVDPPDAIPTPETKSAKQKPESIPTPEAKDNKAKAS